MTPDMHEAPPILLAEGMHKRYGGVHALRGATLCVNPRRGARADGRERLGQVHVAADPLGPDPTRRRIHPVRRPTDLVPGSDGCAAPGHRDGHAGDDARTRPLGRREHLPRASHGAARRPRRLEDDARAGARGDRAARAGARPVAPGPPTAARPAADGRDRACPLDRRAPVDPRRAHELPHRRRGRVALRSGTEASGRRCLDDLRLASDRRGLRARRSHLRIAGRPERRRGRDGGADPGSAHPHDGRPRARGGDARRGGEGIDDHRWPSCHFRARTLRSGPLRRHRPRRRCRRDRWARRAGRSGKKRAAGDALRTAGRERGNGRDRRRATGAPFATRRYPQSGGLRPRGSQDTGPRAGAKRPREPRHGRDVSGAAAELPAPGS